ncbi:MAG: SPW repeat protein [Gemmatimonas sp.]
MMGQEPSGLWWAVIDVLFVVALGVAIAFATVARRKRDGSLGLASETVQPTPEVRATGRWGRWQDIVVMLLAIWLSFAPVAFPDEVGQGMSANAIIVGVVLGAIALAAVYRMDAPNEWAILVAGAWVFLSPWVLGFTDTPRASWNHWIVGALVVILSAWELLALRRMPALSSDPSQSRRRSRMTG